MQLIDPSVCYTAPITVIGKHEWAMQVYAHPGYGLCTRFRWRRCGAGDAAWQPERDWPRYDFNDGLYGGLPRTLVRYYRQHQAAIEAALGRSGQAELLLDPVAGERIVAGSGGSPHSRHGIG